MFASPPPPWPREPWKPRKRAFGLTILGAVLSTVIITGLVPLIQKAPTITLSIIAGVIGILVAARIVTLFVHDLREFRRIGKP